MSSGTVRPKDFYSGTNVFFGKFGKWLFSSVFLAVVFGGVRVLTAARNAALATSTFIARQVTGVLGAAISIPVDATTAAWQAPLPFVRALGFLSGPVGLGIFLLALGVLWTGVLD